MFERLSISYIDELFSKLYFCLNTLQKKELKAIKDYIKMCLFICIGVGLMLCGYTKQ